MAAEAGNPAGKRDSGTRKGDTFSQVTRLPGLEGSGSRLCPYRDFFDRPCCSYLRWCGGFMKGGLKTREGLSLVSVGHRNWG